MASLFLRAASDCSPVGSSINKNHIRYFFMTIDYDWEPLDGGRSSRQRDLQINNYTSPRAAEPGRGARG